MSQPKITKEADKDRATDLHVKLARSEALVDRYAGYRAPEEDALTRS
jgi:hypothetical protein